MKNNFKSIILLSGGLDSVVALGLTIQKYNVQLALTFNYGQKSFEQELFASKKFADFYNIKHEVIELPFLNKITSNDIVQNDNVVASDTSDIKSLWVPNRNGLFINIAASWADAYDYKYIIFGANKEEAEEFPDNRIDFIESVNNTLKKSTLVGVEVVAPLVRYDKNEIVKQALDNNIPLDWVRSCYYQGDKNCGKCSSCLKLISSLKYNGANEYIEKLF